MDIWGEAGVTAEAELIAALLTLVRELGLPAGTVKVRINSRALLEESLRQGVLAERPEAFAPLCVIIDKLDKIGEEAVRDMLCAAEGSIGLQPAEAESVLQMLRARNLDEAAEAGGEGSAALRDLKRLFELLEAYGVADDVIFDASVVRGLAYYTGIVFEAFDAQGELRAICGGGRYDRLLETLGGKSIPAVGFGFGDVVITELLKDQNLLPEPTQELDDIVFAFSEAEQIAAAQLATQLRAEGRQVELILGKMKPKRVFADAAAKGASRVFLIGPDDLVAGKAAVKELSTGEQTDWPLYPK
jgi:histidyl-tRNA synthetase